MHNKNWTDTIGNGMMCLTKRVILLKGDIKP